MDLVFFLSISTFNVRSIGSGVFFISLRFLSMNLSQSYDLSHGFNRLTRVDSGYFLGYFFLIDFFRFHISTLD
jgi:hypothetical protein